MTQAVALPTPGAASAAPTVPRGAATPPQVVAQSPARLREIVEIALEHTVNGVVITDATQPNHPIVHVNEGFSRITGFSAREVLGRNCNVLQGTDRQQPAVSILRDAIARREAVVVVLRNYRKDGSLFYNRVEMCPVADPHSGDVTHFFALQTDVTLQVLADQARERRLLSLERAFEGSPVGMVAFDEHGEVTLATPAAAKLLALEVPLVGMSMTELRDCVAGCAGTDPQASAALRWPEPGEALQWTLGGHAPRVIEVEAAVQPDDGSTAPERIVLLRDVSEEQSDHANRSRFLAMAAHELRTPLGSIRGFTELLLLRDYPRAQACQMLETVLNQASRLGALLNDLLDLSQMDAMGREAFTMGAVDLGAVMRRAVQVLLVPGSARSIEVDLPDTALHVHGHAAKLEQVLINLLSNALKYSPDGGEVRLRAQPDAEGRRVLVSVSDQGIGLTPEQQARLFTRFYRANPGGPIPGTGLGLTIVKELVERMGGRISVQSRAGQGSTFTIELLPCDAAPALRTDRKDSHEH